MKYFRNKNKLLDYKTIIQKKILYNYVGAFLRK